MTEPEEDESFGQKEPPLTANIVSILGRYPDGGQILKELIQNADDAGAREVKFLYDGRSFGTKYLTSEHLRKFQGPALYAFNDAIFKPEDWKGIQNLMQSNKKSDILKAGRFGIGFNSVYHITDLPGIVSGQKIGFLDPHKLCFKEGESGKQYLFNSSLLKGEIRHQFEPFQGVFNLDFGESYESTLFRFPLRTCSSELSEAIYTKEKVNKLFESLREEASIILLFLKNVQHISVHERNHGDEGVTCLFKVEIAPRDYDMVKLERETMLKKAVSVGEGVIESKYVVDIILTSEAEKRVFNWLVLNQIGVLGDERILELSEKLCLLPWVGCAIPINENAQKEDSGRIFCFLPLPHDVDCQTGLPLLVHGTFGVTDNRRGLLWPGSECQNNETAEWNLLLVEKILSSVLYNALKSIITNDPFTGLDDKRKCQLVYRTVPVLGNVVGHWKSLLDPLFHALKNQELNWFYAQSSKGTSWITLQEGLLDQMQSLGVASEIRHAVVQTLLSSSRVVISDLPSHVSEIVKKYFHKRQEISSTFFREFMKSCNIVVPTSCDKLLLLEYILHDDPLPEMLIGIPLLPLASKKFVLFGQHCHTSDPSSSIYVSNGNCTRELLPNMESHFLDENIPVKTFEKLVAMASSVLDKNNPTQMVLLTPDLVVNCLRDSLPQEWFNVNQMNDAVFWKLECPSHPPEKWITDIWHWINETFVDSLESLEKLPLIRFVVQSEKKLGFLSKCSKFIFTSDSSKNMLPREVVGLLEAAGCTVLPWSSMFLHVRHPDISSYIASPVPGEVTVLLHRSSVKSAEKYVTDSSKGDRKVLRDFFALSQEPSEDQIYVLRHLPLFDTLDGTSTAASVNSSLLSAAAPQFNLPADFNFRKSSDVISSADPASLKLVHLLDLELLAPGDVFCRFLFPDIQSQSIYTREETTTIMLYILERLSELQNCSKFLEEIKDLPFITTRSEEVKKPCELYDPKDQVLSDLFLGEGNKFPSEEFSETRVISILQDLGLQTIETIKEHDLLGVAENVASMDYRSAVKKVQAMFIIFEKYPEFLQPKLTLKLAELEWLPRAKKRPRGTGYPEYMHWYSSDISVFKPGALYRESHSVLVGSSAPVLGIKSNESGSALLDLLGVKKTANISEVVEHLRNAVEYWDDKELKRPSPQYVEMLRKIYSHLSDAVSYENVAKVIEERNLLRWVWHGSGFCSPGQIALENDLPFDLRPPLFLLPDEFNDSGRFTEFFKSLGVRMTFSKEDILCVLTAIKDRHEDVSSAISSKCQEKDLKFCRSILEWLVSDGEALSESLRQKIYVPVQCVENKLVLKLCGECTYFDQEWLKRGKTDLDIPNDIFLIHESIPTKLAILLGVPSLSSCLLSAESIEFEQTGPYEPITTRINNILKEYKEGIGIFKELIQNADDAGATTVKFLIDWRHGKIDSLFSPDMAPCQGPALWAYNDAVFTDKDFENINKLAGGTKVEDLSKIGRFGLGFNAVYHLTDVPSFISRSYLCMFDPNVNHIANHIRDKSRPGIRIDLAKNPRPLSAFADQFYLHDNVFGCKTDANSLEVFSYPGTLFRFPFRTTSEAKRSEICKSVYDSLKVKEIVRKLRESATLLLLYTQHVRHVELHELQRTQTPHDMALVLSINKEIESASHVTVPYIKRCSDWWQQSLTSCSSEEAPSSLESVKIVVTEKKSTLTSCEASAVKIFTWLVAHCVGADNSLTFAKDEGQKDGLLPLAGAAALLKSQSNSNAVDRAASVAEEVLGEAFCFLPLSISTGLPVHVNSSFAVRSNRDGIWERTTAEENRESRWNELLLEDAIPEAYFKLLDGMVTFSKNGCLPEFDQRFHDFWPRVLSTPSKTWRILVTNFYSKLIDRALELFCSDGTWMDISKGFILDDDLREKLVNGVVETLQFLGNNVFDLPSDVINSMNESAKGSHVLERQTLSLVSFYEKFLFPNLSKIPSEVRDPIVHDGLRYVLDESRQDSKTLESLYRDHRCIPTSPDGVKLVQPCELIHPHEKSVSVLFAPEENRFPFGQLDHRQLCALEKLGMVKDLLCWKEVCGRAKSIEELANKSTSLALERSRFLITYLRRNLERLRDEEDISNELLADIKFLPVRCVPPKSYTLPWKGTDVTQFFQSPNDLFLLEDAELIGSSCYIVNDTVETGCGNLDEKVKSVLGFTSRRPSSRQVLQQLKITTKSMANDKIDDDLQKLCSLVCRRVYQYLDKKFSDNPNDEVIEELKSIPWLYLDGKFVESRLVALEWQGYAVPYLYGVPDDYRRSYVDLLKVTGIKTKFKPGDFLEALDSFSQSMQDVRLTQEDVKLVVILTNELKNGLDDQTVKSRLGTIALPDSGCVLRNSEDLTIPEDFKVVFLPQEHVIHPDIAPSIALKLGAKPLRARRREMYGNAMSMSFGQHEPLTVRIKNILEGYPCDEGILKELVQNADDAMATEVHFIHDMRTLPHQRVLQNHAAEIQGPALCIYNDKHFSEDDFRGICNLGIGSKKDDPEKTGQYGIGFNAVYHLTDCPSFLSDDSTLCILDPHCKYSPEATLEAPGGRYNNIDEGFREIFSDSLRGYLGDHFSLKGSTMFRLPLRTRSQATTSHISKRHFLESSDIKSLLSSFQWEAKKLLLFLNHVKKVSLSEINHQSTLKFVYSVSSIIEEKYEKNQQDLHSHLKENKKVATADILKKEATYTICIEDTVKLKENWLIHQCCGIKKDTTTDEKVPNGCDLGLFPRGGIAALLPTGSNPQKEYVAYCFLPLPVRTYLPVHVNGHFALDGSRRNLWSDTKNDCQKTHWNVFMKTQVLAPAYASLIYKAREYIPGCEGNVGKIYFSSEDHAQKALDWYHNLFPAPAKDSSWSILAVAVYKSFKEASILPVIAKSDDIVTTRKIKGDHANRASLSRSLRSQDHKRSDRKVSETRDKEATISSVRYPAKTFPRRTQRTESARASNLERGKEARHLAVTQGRNSETNALCIREWLPTHRVFFTKEEERQGNEVLFAALLQINMPLLLFTPSWIHDALQYSALEHHLLSPENVVEFLLGPNCKIAELPIRLGESNLRTMSNLRSILEYCQNLKDFAKKIKGLPLLLTADGMLREFTMESPAYCSSFCDLFPTKSFRFVHPNFVKLLSNFSTDDGVIRNLTVKSLSNEFLYDVFKDKLPLSQKKHVAWNYPKEGVLSKNWFCHLWEFLKTAVSAENGIPNIIVDLLGRYPIIPTKRRELAAVEYSKSVLATTNPTSDNSLQQDVTKILENLACPFLDELIAKKALSLVRSLVSNRHCVCDVLHVLEYVNSTNTIDTKNFDLHQISSLLKFVEEDSRNEESMKIAKTLPLYKSVDGEYHALSSYSSYIRVPRGLPDIGLKELQSLYGQKMLFLPPGYDLHQLYKALGVVMDCQTSQFYTKYVLPRFSFLTRESQIEFLTSIKNMPVLLQDDELLEKLRSTNCIPDQTGALRLPSSYCNPFDDIFKVMFESDASVFPMSPYNEKKWIPFLTQIGLKNNCNEKQFVVFAREVEKSAEINVFGTNEVIGHKSIALVTYMLSKEHVRTWSFHQIPTIKFIVPAEVEEELSSLSSQYRLNGNLEYVAYQNSVQWKDRRLAWTCAELLPEWAYPREPHLVSLLNIPSKPPLEAVMSHLKTISKCVSDLLKSDDFSLPETVVNIFINIYEFFHGSIKCGKGPPSEKCGQECQQIGDCLAPVACILLSEEKRLVKGEELSFEVKKDLKPHFYCVPRSFVPYEHLLKRLGVTEKINASQMASVLKSIKDSCVKTTLSSIEETKAHGATATLFKSLLAEKEIEVESRLSKCEVLYLQSMTKKLVETTSLVTKMQPRLRESVASLGHEILCPLEKSGLKRALENDYLEALPKRLRPTQLSSLVREELDPLSHICSYCSKMNCPFIDRFILLLRSSQFERGVLRFLKHQRNSTNIDDEDKARAARFSSAKLTVIKCMKEVKVRLVDVLTDSALPRSTTERACHVAKGANSWTLYIQHEFGGRTSHAILAKAVNEIMDGCLEGIGELSDMLSCDSPSQIPDVLSAHNVSIDHNEEGEELGQVVPEVFHFLMIQDPLCQFDEGTRVAYGVDQICGGDWKDEDQEKESTIYTLAKILGRAGASSHQEYDFNAEYKIDLGSKTDFKTVSVLDIYSYKQDEDGNLVSEDDGEPEVSVNVCNEKLRIRRALLLAKELDSVTQRRKVLRRLFLHWLRCKNPEATAALTDFIESEVNRLKVLQKEEFRFGYWRSRGRWEQTIFDSYDHWTNYDRHFGSRVYSIRDATEYVSPDQEEAKRWIKQSAADLKVARSLRRESHSQVCFMSQQCVEKCLKGVLYAKCGIPRRELHTHYIDRLVSSVRRLDGVPNVDRANLVSSYYLQTRYPDNQPKYRVPAEEFKEEQAKEALEVAETIFTSMERFVYRN